MSELELEDRERFEQLVLPYVDAALTSRVGCCAGAPMPRMSPKKLCSVHAVSSAAFRAEMRARGYCRSYAILAIPGWRRTVLWN